MWGIHAGVLEACSHVVPRVLSSHAQSRFSLFLWYSFSSLSLAHTIVLEMCAIFLVHTDTHHPLFSPIFIWLYLPRPHLQLWSSISKHIAWSDHKIVRNTNTAFYLPELKHSLLFWARVSAFARMYVTTNHTRPKFFLNAASEQGMRLCQCEGPVSHTQGLSLFVS